MTDQVIVPIKEHQKLFLLWRGEKDIDITVRLEIPRTGIDIYGIILGNKQTQGTIRITVEHLAPQTKSFVLLKGLLTDETSVTFKGLTTIRQGAKQTDAWLSCYYLLLSDNAQGQAIPSLEIRENDVKAGHATTAGKLDWNQIFYLMSRGLSESEARKLLVEGYILDVLRFMPQHLGRVVREELQYYGY